MPEKIHKITDVFGIGRELPLNYVSRKKVDNVFKENLSREKHLVAYGSSKQGKTSLRKKCIGDDAHIVVSCLNTMSLSDLHAAILKKTGYKVELSETQTASGQQKVIAEFKGKGKVPLVAEVEGGVVLESTDINENTKDIAPLELDLSDVNDIIAALINIELDQLIILEDFHYLPVDTQKNFAFALKSFHENSNLCFVVVGVWRDKNRLIYYNGDLAGRVMSIDADEWSEDELTEVIKAGEALLNIDFDKSFVDGLLSHAYEAVYLVQEACLQACRVSGIEQTCDKMTTIGTDLDPKQIIEDIVGEQGKRCGCPILSRTSLI